MWGGGGGGGGEITIDHFSRTLRYKVKLIGVGLY